MIPAKMIQAGGIAVVVFDFTFPNFRSMLDLADVELNVLATANLLEIAGLLGLDAAKARADSFEDNIVGFSLVSKNC